MMPLPLFLISSLLLALSHNCAPAPAEGELFLTPLIKSGDVDKAKAISVDNMKISKIKSEKEFKSYSGYLTIDETKNSNLFFWFFPAQENPEKAPVILWINDIPGYTCLKGVFMETGPFYIDQDNKLQERNNSWVRTRSMLYIDAPVGTGFSFADSEDAYAKNSDDEAVEMYEALQQFFTLFKEFQPNDFYLAGESYAGAFMPHIAKKLHTENQKAALKINLKGLIMASPCLEPVQHRRDSQYRALHLMSEKQRMELVKAEDQFFDLHKQGKDAEALAFGYKIFLTPDALVSKLSGFPPDSRNALTTKPIPQLERFVKFIDSKEVHNYLHTGLHKFVATNTEVLLKFGSDMFVSHSAILQELLDLDYRVLIYVGQFDLLIAPDELEPVVLNMKWKKSSNFVSAPRNVWRVKDDIGGYTQSAGNLVFALIRNAGNYAIMDQPEWTNELVQLFLAGKDF